MNRFEVDGAALATEPPQPALENRGFEYARAFQNRVVEWIQEGEEPVSVVRAPTGAGKTATFHELIRSQDMTLLVYPTNALLRQQRERFEEEENVDVGILNSNSLEGHGRERTENLIQIGNKYATDHDVVLTNPDILQAAIQAMYRGSDPMRFFNNFSAIVYDEFHFYDVLAASGLLLQIKVIEDRSNDPKILLASATPNEDFVEFLRDRIGLTIRDIEAEYTNDGDQFRRLVNVVRHKERTLLKHREEIATELRKEIEYAEDYDEPHAVVIFNSAKDSNDFHDYLYREHSKVFEHTVKDNGFDTDDEDVDIDDEKFYILNTTSKGEVGLDYDITTLYMEKPLQASDFLQRFGRAGRQSEATVYVYGLGQGSWEDDVNFPKFTEQIYHGLESTAMNQDQLADLVGFRAAYAIYVREEEPRWFNQELREDFEKNIDQYNRWHRFIETVESELEEVQEGFESGKYPKDTEPAKLLQFTDRCFEVFSGLRGQSLPASIKYPRGDRLGATTYDLTSTLRNYNIERVEDNYTIVLKPQGDGAISTVTARLPAYDTEPTQYDKSTFKIEELLQTKVHRRIDQMKSKEEFEVSTELLHRFFRIIRIVDAVVPSRITTSNYDITVDNPPNGPPDLEINRRQV